MKLCCLFQQGGYEIRGSASAPEMGTDPATFFGFGFEFRVKPDPGSGGRLGDPGSEGVGGVWGAKSPVAEDKGVRRWAIFVIFQ